MKLPWLTNAIGGVVLFTAMGLLFAPRWVAWAQRQRGVGGHPTALPVLAIGAGAVLGLVVALTSVGAGALGSVMLLYLYPRRMTPHRLVATDIVHAIPLAVVAGSGYLLAGMVDGWMLLSLLLGSIPAVVLGSMFAIHVSARRMQVALAMVLALAGLKVLA